MANLVFLLGAAPGVADAASAVMRLRYPKLHIVGTHSPPSLDADDDELTLALVREAHPDVLLVAFGAPRQELWIRKHMRALGVPVCIGVGGRANASKHW
jgi:N-acetylglucosaminyldiphosphoundecaprenol N-acetyl-beta-D-mannosaminyltransferase